MQNKARANSKVAQAPSVKCSAFATSLSEGGSSYNRTKSQLRRGEHCSPVRTGLILGSPSGGAPAKRVRGEEKPSPSRYASHLPLHKGG